MTQDIPSRKGSDHRGEKSHRAEARRFLGTNMQQALIRGLGRDEERTRAWLGTANQLKQEGKIGQGIVDNIVEKLKEAQE